MNRISYKAKYEDVLARLEDTLQINKQLESQHEEDVCIIKDIANCGEMTELLRSVVKLPETYKSLLKRI